MKELFEKGLSYRTFIMNQDMATREKFIKPYISINIGEVYKQKISRITEKVKILGLVEGWCPDCQINLPILEKLISANNNIELKLIKREGLEGKLQALEKYKIDGKLKVPTFIFMDESFDVVGAFIERPSAVRNADINTLEGSKLNMMYRAARLVDETAEELASCFGRLAG